MTTTDKLAAALRGLLNAPSPCDCGPQGCGVAECRTDQREAAETAARTALAEYEATKYAPRIPEEFAREQLDKYAADIADGSVNYPFYAGVFSQLVRGVIPATQPEKQG
jgi:hypothetical protein